MKTQHSPVIAFFGGLTKFSGTKGLFPPLRSYYRVHTVDGWFFTLVESLYEASNPTLFHCCIVADSDNKMEHDVAIEMRTNYKELTPAHMVPLGYFIVHLCSNRTCALQLFNCNYTKSTIETFVKIILSEWAKLDPRPVKPKLTLIISDSCVALATECVSQLIARTCLLKSLRLIIHLAMKYPHWLNPTLFIDKPPEEMCAHLCSLRRPEKYIYSSFPKLSLHSVMRPLIGALSRNSSMVELFMKFHFPYEHEMPTSALIAYSEYYMVLLLLCCRGITEMTLEQFLQVNHPYKLMSAAIALNRNIQWLCLEENVPLAKFTKCLESFAYGIGLNTSLKGLILRQSLTTDTLCWLLLEWARSELVQSDTSLLTCRSLAVDVKPTLGIQFILHLININRGAEEWLIVKYLRREASVALIYDGFGYVVDTDPFTLPDCYQDD